MLLRALTWSTAITNSPESRVAFASCVKLEASLLIEGRGDLAKVALATKVSVFAAQPCAVDGKCLSTVGDCMS